MIINKLSIIIPVYNEEKTIHLILDKIKNASLTNNISKEIIIINDCSTDNSKQALENYSKETQTQTLPYTIKTQIKEKVLPFI